MARRIDAVAVLGAGTMGSGIAALCAQADCRVLLLDMTRDAADQALARMTSGRAPLLDDPASAARIATGSLAADLVGIGDHDWICEAVIEDLATKRSLFAQIEPLRRAGSVVSSNTSGIPLRAITDGLPERLRQDIAVTHFFNPVKVMKLVELVPGAATTPEVLQTFTAFLADRLGKGVVHAKDTVNFIGNRIGCFWMLSGLQKADAALASGLAMEEIDALIARPFGIPSTGLFGLIDLIGLDVMELVGRNLAANLPPGDPGHAYTRLPEAERAMLQRGQLGRKTGGGFYRLLQREDGSRAKETFDLAAGSWRPSRTVDLDPGHQDAASLIFGTDLPGRFAWEVMGGTLCYAADLIPEIADDVVNVDRALRWGFNWAKGPFELLDALQPRRVIERLGAEGRPLPRMLQVLRGAGAESFYRDDGRHLGLDGSWHDPG
ncbi:MAG TPA: 3-hydroxyacyl-CoA dehydrogenase family protein [Geminicoccaceae bacterium]|nr:3-hydroxyacyl-CoA dehydrogenase family protein [Geminicoccaceae bacterium]